MWLTIRQLPMKAGWWDSPLEFRVLAVSNLPQFLSFCKIHLTPPAHNLVIPLLHRFYTPISCNKAEHIWLLRGLNQGFHGGTFTSQLPLMLCYKFYTFFDATTTVQDWPWTYSPFQSLHKTFFSAPPRPIFSRIHLLGGKGRHVWRIVRSRVQRPESRV